MTGFELRRWNQKRNEGMDMKLFNVERTSRCILLQLVALLLLLVGSKGAWASTCSGGGQTIQLGLPATVSVPRDAAAGTPISNWVYSTDANIWDCNWSAGINYGSKAKLASSYGVASGVTTTANGVTYTVYKTSVPGVGIAVSFRENFVPYSCSYTGGWSGYYNVLADWFGFQCLPPSAGAHSGAAGGEIGVRLIATGEQVNVAGTNQVTGVVANMAALENSSVIGNMNSYSVSVTVNVLACTTPNVDVPMGDYSAGDFVGGVVKAVPFSIKLNSCPAGMTSVQYQLDPNTTVVNDAQAVVALDGTSTASGVGVQVLNSAGTAPFGKFGTLQNCNCYTNTGGNFTIPLQARYYQTGATINPGAANTSMTFTMSYQ
jgi:major type 1 subunit fimbrin (pilin)